MPRTTSFVRKKPFEWRGRWPSTDLFPQPVGKRVWLSCLLTTKCFIQKPLRTSNDEAPVTEMLMLFAFPLNLISTESWGPKWCLHGEVESHSECRLWHSEDRVQKSAPKIVSRLVTCGQCIRSRDKTRRDETRFTFQSSFCVLYTVNNLTVDRHALLLLAIYSMYGSPWNMFIIDISDVAPIQVIVMASCLFSEHR